MTAVLSLFVALAVILLPGRVWAQAGASWTPVPAISNQDGLSSELSGDGQVAVFGAWGGPIHVTTDGGTNWNSVLAGVTATGVAISSNGSRIYLATRDSQIRVSSDSGANWGSFGSSRFWDDIACSADGMFAVACAGIDSVFVTTDGGANWTEKVVALASTITRVDCSSDGLKLVATAFNGFIYTSTDSGETWTARDDSRSWNGVTSSADGTKLAATVNPGFIYTSTDSGVTWTARDVSRFWGRIDSSSDGSVLVTSINENLFTSTDSGETWTQRLSVPGGNWRGQSVSGDGLKMLAPAGGGSVSNPLHISTSSSAPEITGMNRYLLIGGVGTATPGQVMRLNPAGTSITERINMPAIPADSAFPVFNPTNGIVSYSNGFFHLPTLLSSGSAAVTTWTTSAGNAVAHGPSGKFLSSFRNGTASSPVRTFDPVANTAVDGALHSTFIPEANWIYNGYYYTAGENGGVERVLINPDGTTSGNTTSQFNTFGNLGIPNTNGGYSEVVRAATNPADGTTLLGNLSLTIYLFDLDGPFTSGNYTSINLASHLTMSGGGFTGTSGVVQGILFDPDNSFFYVAGSIFNFGFGEARDFLVRVTPAGVVTPMLQELDGDLVFGGTSGSVAGLGFAPVSGNTFSLTENSANSTVVGTLTATDPDPGTTFSDWTIVSGNTGGAFALNASTGQITVATSAALNFETTPVFTLSVTVSDGANTSAPVDVTINLTNVNEPATDITLSGTTVAENAAANTVVGSLAATGDPDAGAPHVFTLVAGGGSTDNGAFNIDGNNLRLTASANFEAKPSYSIRLRATDSLGATFEKAFTITVTNVNEPPTSISLSATSLPENGGIDAVVGIISALGDPDAGAAHTFNLEPGTGDADNGAFNISTNSLRLSANGDFETKSSYSIRLRASDGLGGSIEQQFTVTLTNVNEAPTGLTLSSSSINENNAPNATVGTLTATGDPDASAMHGYSLVVGAGDEDNGAFNILGSALRLTGVADFETKASYSIRLQASDGLGGFYSNSYTITVIDVPEGATDITLTNASLPENNTPPTTVGTLAAIGDPNPGDSHTFSLVAGPGSTDNVSFLLSGSTLRLNVAANFEVKPTYSIRVQADDGTGGLFAKALTVSITNVNEPPTDLTLSNASVPENSGANGVIGMVAATGDPDAGATHVFTLVTGTGSTDNALFTLTGSTLRIVPDPDFETKASYAVRMRADDGFGGVFEKSFTISITDVNEAPTDISLTSATVAENGAANATVGTLAALGDPDTGAAHTFTLVAGTGSTDNAAFNISGTSLRLTASADFEAKPSYSVRVQASDGLGGTYAKPFTVTVTDVNEAPTGISLTNASVAENAGSNAVVGAVSGVDPDAGATLTYSLVAGAGDTDNASFNISAGNLRLNADADFETKASYSVRLRANDGSLFFEEAFTITVTNVNEAPTDITINDANVDENAGANAVVGAFTTVGDPDAGAVHSYTLVSGVDDDDNAAFNINGANLRLIASANFEVKASYKVRVRTSDGLGGVFEKAFTITVNNVNEAPTDLTLSNTSVLENAGANAVVGTLAAAGDPDAGATHNYALVAGPGATDNSDFNIDGASLRLTASANFESKASYSVRVRTDDGIGGIFEKVFTITVTNVNESPTDLSLSNASVSENAGANAVVGALSAIGDPDAGATHSFAFVSGTGDTDNAAFILSGNSLRLSASADFETKSSYSIRVEANDGLGGTFAKSFTITVTNVNEAPTDLSLSGTTVSENAGANFVVGTLAALGDPDAAAAHTYTLVAGTGATDNAAFNISGTSLRLNASADFETKSSYSVRVQGDDGLGGTFAKAFTVLVLNVNEAPTDISLSGTSVPENAGANATIGTLAALGDPDGGASHTYSLVAGAGDTDNASFSISGSNLRLTASANFEAKASYSVRIRADDGDSGTFEKSFAITITDVNEVPSADGVTAVGDEDATGITVTFLGADPDNDDLTYEIVTPPLAGEGTLGAVVDNTVVFTPATNYNGVVVFTYKALDGEFESSSATATVTVNAINDVPTITNIESLTVLEDGTTGELAFIVNDVDAGAMLSVSAYTNNQDLAPDARLVLGGEAGSRTITVTPEADQNGIALVTVQVSDGLLTATDTFTLTVTPVNDEPSFTLNPAPILPGANLAEGRVWAWGLNGSGQVGDGSIASAGSPVQIGSHTDWVELATGDYYTIALKKDGSLWAWGANGSGQLGNGTTVSSDIPRQIGEDLDWKSISAGDGHVLALKLDGTLWAWGNNTYGQTGNGSTSAVLAPVQIGTETNWKMASAGGLHSLALKSDGTLWAWGRNQFSQLGNGSTATVTAPVQIGTSTDWTFVAAGGTHSVALKRDLIEAADPSMATNTLWAWGRGGEGQLGDGTTNTRTTPKQIGMDTNWQSIVAGYTFTAAIKDDGTLWAWGRNGDGQLADGTRTNRTSPQQIGTEMDWATLSAGRYHALALKLDGTLWTWGDNQYSQLGNDGTVDALAPIQLGTGIWSKIAGGFGHSVAIEPETSRLTVPANSGPFTILNFATDILAGPSDEVTQNVTFEVTNDDNSLFVAQPAIAPDGTLTLTPGVNAGTMTVTVYGRDNGGSANGGDDLSKAKRFSIRITVAPEMDITGNETEILNGDSTPIVDDHTDFGMTPTVGETVTRTFTITNSGTAPLNLTGVPMVTLSGSPAFTVSAQPTVSVVERLGGTQTFSVTFDPTIAEVVTATVSIVNDDDDENPYTFVISGEGITPEIGLTGNETDIINGSETTSAGNHTHFGDSPVVGGTVVRTFTIANTGKQDLSLTGSPIVSVSGSADFTVTAQPASSTVAALSGTTTFQITYNPSTRGSHGATVSITSNDEDEAPFTFAIAGVGTSPEITVYGNENAITAGDTTPSASDHTAFGSLGGAMQRTFSIANEGNLELVLGSPVISLNGSASFSIVDSPTAATTVAPEGSPANFTIAFDPSTPGTQTTIVTVASNDEDESSYSFTLQGTGIPAFTVPTFTGINGGAVVNLASLMGPLPTGGVFSGPGVTNGIFNPNLLDPGEYTLTYTIKDATGEDFSIDFDVTVELLPARIEVERLRKFKTTEVRKKSPPQTIVITNTGKVTMSGLSVSISGKGARDYDLSRIGATTLEGGRSTTVSVIFKPRAAGSRRATVTFQAAGVAPVRITLSGVGKARNGVLNPRFQ